MSNLDPDEIFPILDVKPPEILQSENSEPTFIPHRVFLNQLDSYHAKYIASVSAN